MAETKEDADMREFYRNVRDVILQAEGERSSWRRACDGAAERTHEKGTNDEGRQQDEGGDQGGGEGLRPRKPRRV
jgi:hypothetical protein